MLHELSLSIKIQKTSKFLIVAITSNGKKLLGIPPTFLESWNPNISRSGGFSQRTSMLLMDGHHLGDLYFHRFLGWEVSSGCPSNDSGNLLVFPLVSLLVFATRPSFYNF